MMVKMFCGPSLVSLCTLVSQGLGHTRVIQPIGRMILSINDNLIFRMEDRLDGSRRFNTKVQGTNCVTFFYRLWTIIHRMCTPYILYTLYATWIHIRCTSMHREGRWPPSYLLRWGEIIEAAWRDPSDGP